MWTLLNFLSLTKPSCNNINLSVPPERVSTKRFSFLLRSISTYAVDSPSFQQCMHPAPTIIPFFSCIFVFPSLQVPLLLRSLPWKGKENLLHSYISFIKKFLHNILLYPLVVKCLKRIFTHYFTFSFIFSYWGITDI